MPRRGATMTDRLEEGPRGVRELVDQLAADLHVFANRLTESSLGSPAWIPSVIGDLCQLGEDFRILRGEVAQHLVINDGVGPRLFRQFSDRRGLDLWMLTVALATTGGALEDLALALEQLPPRRHWRALTDSRGPHEPNRPVNE